MIHSTKHYVQTTPTSVAAAAINGVNIVNAVAVQDKQSAVSNSVEEGSTVKAIYFEYWLLSDNSPESSSSFIFVIEKIPANAGNISFAEANFLYGYVNKKNVLFVSQGLMAHQDANPVPIVRGWINIPKGKQRMGLGDKIRVSVAGLAGEISFCGMSVFKEYQ